MAADMATIMGEVATTLPLIRLMTWLSPAFPVGSFAYSGGLERAVEDGYVKDEVSLAAWISSLLSHGSLWNDAVLFAAAYQQSDDASVLAELADLGDALAGSRERHQELTFLGGAFLTAASAWPHPVLATLPVDTVYPVAVGAVAGAHGVGLDNGLAAFLNAGLGQLVSVAIRCGVLGQVRGVALISGMEATIQTIAGKAAVSTLDDLGSATFLADISSLRHEVQVTRLFRS